MVRNKILSSSTIRAEPQEVETLSPSAVVVKEEVEELFNYVELSSADSAVGEPSKKKIRTE